MIVNASSDGAFGLTVSAWCEGLALAQGMGIGDVVAPLPGPTRQLVAALRVQLSRAPPGTDPVEHARAIAIEYVRANPGQQYDVFRFVRWCNSNRGEDRPSGVRRSAPQQQEPSTGRLWKVGK